MIKGASLFTNVGIDEHYFEKNGIKIVLANELLENRSKFYKHLYPESEMIQGDITQKEIFDLLIQKFIDKKCSFLIATPPCQGMSIAGRMDPKDKRNELIKYVIKFVKQTLPDNILIENVPNLLKFSINVNKKNVLIKDYIVNEFTKMGYYVNFSILDAADYKTPQHRKRAIFLISKISNWELPKKSEVITVKDAIYDLPTLESGEKSEIKYHYSKKHNINQVLWMKNTPSGKTAFDNKINFPQLSNGQKIKGFKTTYKRISWDKPAPTITMANGSISSQNNVHPGRELKDKTFSDARVLTILELLRLTGLPDDWNIPEWASDNFVRQVIGESFPPKFAEEIIKNIPRKKKK
ncbi:modification methylase HgaI-1 [Mesoplasma florum W37]|uniref:DNA (cytosine-5-)-methyltransferase n=1 Tax=Mesoplasma florum TaxID=2151 RepID=A0AAD2PST2_MESFO|nr:DNA cytosine methyltransferase [Mesoplasma florum]AGY41395.1 modification methylase HgaI-1 [Mesoplasma florum W37]AVN59615.1 DNA cytosine methyltransferase [Mesoplasma florum]AVN65735.1 DNA-cytosine methyltransferase [Mesoplasma florum]